jgi:site-specific recombinase XerD
MSRDIQKIKHLTPEEKKELLNVIYNDTTLHKLRNIAIFEVALCCALRVSEITIMRKNAYAPTDSALFCQRIKGSCSNTVILSKSASNALVAYLKERDSKHDNSNFMFTSQKGNPISRSMLDVLIKKYCKLTSISEDKHHFHVLKHTRAMELINKEGIDLTQVQWLLGHRNIENTMLYLKFTPARQKYFFDKIYRDEDDDEKTNNE